MLAITTAGFNMQGVCYEQRLYVSKVLEGVLVADHVFGVIFTIDKGDDPYDERVWKKANPMLGVTPSLKKMREYAADAQASPQAEGNFKTKNLNVWLNAASAWLNMAQWRACADPQLSWADFDGLKVYVGADLADKDDMTAAVLAAFRPSPTLPGQTQLIFKPVFWLPEAVLLDPKHAQGRGAAPYRTWAAQDHLKLTPGDWVDHGEVEAQIRSWQERYPDMERVTGDQFAAMQLMASRLNEDLATPDRPLAQILQKNAANVTDAARELEARVKGGPRSPPARRQPGDELDGGQRGRRPPARRDPPAHQGDADVAEQDRRDRRRDQRDPPGRRGEARRAGLVLGDPGLVAGAAPGLWGRLLGRKSVQSLSWLPDWFVGPAARSGVSVTWETALQSVAILACCKVIAEDIAQVSCRLMRPLAGGRGFEPAIDHPLFPPAAPQAERLADRLRVLGDGRLAPGADGQRLRLHQQGRRRAHRGADHP